MKKTLTVCSVLLTSVTSALLWGNQTVQTPSNSKHAPSTKRSGPEDSPEPASPWTSGTVNILQLTDNFFFLIYGLLNRGGPVQEKWQFFWGQYGHNGFLKGCVILASIIKYCWTWFNNKFLQESIIWVGAVQLKICVLVTPPLLLDFVYPPEEKTTK